MKLVNVLFLIIAATAMMASAQTDSSVVVDNVDNSALVYLENEANVVFSSKGDLLVAWQTADDVSQIAFSKYDYDFGEWSAPQNISSAIIQAMNPSLAADKNGNVYVLWQQQDDTATYKTRDALFFSKYDGIAWSTPKDLTGYDLDNGEATMAIGSSGEIFIAWNTDGDKTIEAVFSMHSKDGGETWSPVDTLSAGHAALKDQSDAGRVILAAGSNGKMAAVWANKPAGFTKMETFCNQFDGKWSWPVMVTDSSGAKNDRYPSVVINSKDQIQVLVQDYENNSNRFLKLYTKSWDDPTFQATFDTIVAKGFQTSYPWMAIDKNDKLHVTFRRKAMDAVTVNWEVAYVSSIDGGKTWREQLRISRFAHDAAYPSITVGDSIVAAVWRESSASNSSAGPYAIVFTKLDKVMPTAVPQTLEGVPFTFELAQNHPNPFNPVTNIAYTIDKTGYYQLSIYNVMGQKIRTLVDGNLKAGQYLEKWDGRDEHGHQMTSGVYLYRLRGQNRSITQKMMFVR